MIINKFKVNGFSLIEVLIAIAIVALIATVSLPLFSISSKNIFDSKSNTMDLFVAESKVEQGLGEFKGNGEIKIDTSNSIKYKTYEVIENGVSIIYFKYDEAQVTSP